MAAEEHPHESKGQVGSVKITDSMVLGFLRSRGRRLRQLPRNVWMLGSVSFLTDVSTEMAIVVLPIFMTTTLGMNYAFVGLVEGVAETTASLVKVVSGWLSDRLHQRKRLVVAGYSLSGATRPLLAIAGAGWHVLVARFIDRVGKGVRTSPRDALLADSAAPDTRGLVFGLHRAMDHAGAVVGPLITFGLLAAGLANYRIIFWLATIPAVLTLPLLIRGVSEAAASPSSKGLVIPGGRPVFGKTFWGYLTIVLLFTLGNSSDAFLILRAKSLGIADASIPLLWIALHLSKMLSVVPAGALSDRIGRKRLIIAGWIVYAAVYLGFGCATSPLHIWLLFTFYGFFHGLTEGAERALVADLVPSAGRGRAYGFYNLAIGVGALPASLLMGYLWQEMGVLSAFGFGAVMALVAAIALALGVTPGQRSTHPVV